MKILATLSVTTCFSMASAQQAPLSEVQPAQSWSGLREEFREPPRFEYPHLFWFWDAPVDAEKLTTIAKKALTQKFNPGYAHPRFSLYEHLPHLTSRQIYPDPTPSLPFEQWLSPTWMDAFDQVSDLAEDDQAYFSFCDEYWWPSGQAAGRVVAKNPDLRAQSLITRTHEIQSGSSVRLPKATFCVAARVAEERSPLAGEFESLQDEATILSKTLIVLPLPVENEPLTWTAPASEGRPQTWRIYAFQAEGYNDGPNYGKATPSVNYLNPKLAQAFLTEAYQPYFESHVMEHVGTSLKGVFNDNEGSFGRGIAWSAYLDEQFRKKTGTDIRLILPLLLDRDAEGTWPAARWKWLDVVGDIYSRYFGELSDVLMEKHGLFLISNFWEENLIWQTQMLGDLMKSQREISMPGTDCLQFNVHKASHFKETQTVCEFEGRRLQSEIFGVMRWEGFTPNNMKDGANSLAAWGVSHVVPHGVWTQQRYIDTPWAPDWLDMNPFWPQMHLFNEFIARNNVILAHSRFEPEVLLFNPKDSTSALAGRPYYDGVVRQFHKAFEWADDESQAIARSYIDAMEQLAKARVQYLIGDAFYLDQMELEDAELKRGEHRFRTIVIPPCAFVPQAALAKVVAFAQAGGKVFSLGALPRGSVEEGLGDPEIERLLRKLKAAPGYSGKHSSVSEAVAAGERALASRIHFVNGAFEMIQAHRKVGNDDLYWLANNHDQSQHATIVLVRTQGHVTQISPETGNERSVVATKVGRGLRVTLDFAPHEGFWLRVSDEESPSALLAMTTVSQSAPLEGSWTVQIDPQDQPDIEPAVKPEIPAKYLKPVPISRLVNWGKDPSWGLVNFSGRMTYTLNFDHPAALRGEEFHLDLGQVYHAAEVSLNGTSLGHRLWAPHHFKVRADQLRASQNILKITIGNTLANAYKLPARNPRECNSGLLGPITLSTNR